MNSITLNSASSPSLSDDPSSLTACFLGTKALISSFKKPSELITSEPTFYPHDLTLQYYDQIWNFDRLKRLQDTESEDSESSGVEIESKFRLDGEGVKRPFMNSAIVSAGTIILTIIVCTLGGYALTVLNTPLKNFFFLLVILPI